MVRSPFAQWLETQYPALDPKNPPNMKLFPNAV